LFDGNPGLDEADMEDVLVQAMSDFFNVSVEDDSEIQIAALILRTRRETLSGDFATVDRMWESFAAKSRNAGPLRVEPEAEDSVEEEDEDEDMMDVPMLVAGSKARGEPEIDEDGFTTVARRKR
jgi:pre-rRNA-processing protein TSR2